MNRGRRAPESSRVAVDPAAEVAAELVMLGRWADAREQVQLARQRTATASAGLLRSTELSVAASAVLIEWHTYAGDSEYRSLVDELHVPRTRNELRSEHVAALHAVGSVQLRRGEFDEACITLALARGLVAAEDPLWMPVRGELALARLRGGDWAGAWATIEATDAEAAPDIDARQHAVLAAMRVLRPAFEFDADAVAAMASARAALERAWTPLADAILHHAQTCLIVGSLTWSELLRSTRDVEGRGYRPLHQPSERRTLELLALANEPDHPGVRTLVEDWGAHTDAERSPYYWIARALVAEYDADAAGWTSALERTAEMLTGREDPLGHAHVLMTTGNIVARQSSPREGMVWWEKAREGLRRIGATAFVGLLTRVIEQHSKAIIDHSVNPLRALTSQQRIVVGLVVDGHTSAEIADRLTLSRKTADFHVANALTRLGLSRRRELREVWERWHSVE